VVQVPETTDGVWTPRRRALTLGLVFTVTLVGFEGLSVATILNVISDDLHGISLIGWIYGDVRVGGPMVLSVSRSSAPIGLSHAPRGRYPDRTGARSEHSRGLPPRTAVPPSSLAVSGHWA
jgi:hypothetical protein